MRLIAALMGNGPFMGIIRDFIFINQKWPGDDPIRLLGTNIEINPGDLDGEYDIEVDIGTSPSEKQAIANQIDLFIQFATQAGLQLGIVKPEGIMRAQRKKYRVLGINMNDCMIDEKTFKAEQAQKMQEQQAMQEQQMQMQQAQLQGQQQAEQQQQGMAIQLEGEKHQQGMKQSADKHEQEMVQKSQKHIMDMEIAAEKRAEQQKAMFAAKGERGIENG